jgi:hypothetical protein
MALNLFHDSSIPNLREPARQPAKASLIHGGANDASFYYGRGTAVHKSIVLDTQANTDKFTSDLLWYGLATAAVLYVIYGRK